MTIDSYIKKLAGKDVNKIMAIDGDSESFTIWLKEPYIFVANEAGCISFDSDSFESEAELKKALKWEWNAGIETIEEYKKRFTQK